MPALRWLTSCEEAEGSEGVRHLGTGVMQGRKQVQIELGTKGSVGTGHSNIQEKCIPSRGTSNLKVGQCH